MADQLDPRLEARLRTTLRAEADALPFTLRATELERRAAARLRARSRQRLTLLASAAVVAIAVGGVGLFSFLRLGTDVGRSPSPSQSAPPSPSTAPTGLQVAADCVAVSAGAARPTLAIVESVETKSFLDAGTVTYRKIGTAEPEGDAATWLVDPEPWNSVELAGPPLVFDAGGSCVQALDLRMASSADVAAAITAGTTPAFRSYAVNLAGIGHDISVTDLPTGDLTVRAVVTWWTNGAAPATEVRSFRIFVGTPRSTPTVAPAAHPSPAVPCGTPDAAAKTAPAPVLYRAGVQAGPGVTWSGTWNGTSDDGLPVVPAKAVDLARGTGLEIRIAGDACAKLWIVGYGPVPSDGMFLGNGAILAEQANPTLDPAFAQENRIALAALPAGEWVISVHLVFEAGSGETLFRVRVGG